MVTTAVSIQTMTGAMNYKSTRIYKRCHAFPFCYPFSHISLLIHAHTHVHQYIIYIYIYAYVYIHIYIYTVQISIYRYILKQFLWYQKRHGSNTLPGMRLIPLRPAKWGWLPGVGMWCYVVRAPRPSDSMPGRWARAHQKQICHIKSKAGISVSGALPEITATIWYDYS